jgi:hypothetical protein
MSVLIFICQLSHFLIAEASQDELAERLDKLYTSLAKETNEYEPAADPVFKSREDCIERIIQFTPFNIVDGIWLSGVHMSGKPSPALISPVNL